MSEILATHIGSRVRLGLNGYDSEGVVLAVDEKWVTFGTPYPDVVGNKTYPLRLVESIEVLADD